MLHVRCIGQSSFMFCEQASALFTHLSHHPPKANPNSSLNHPAQIPPPNPHHPPHAPTPTPPHPHPPDHRLLRQHLCAAQVRHPHEEALHLRGHVPPGAHARAAQVQDLDRPQHGVPVKGACCCWGCGCGCAVAVLNPPPFPPLPQHPCPTPNPQPATPHSTP